MDNFGIGAALKAVANIYFMSARKSGRTTAMIDGLKNGDQVIFSNAQEAYRVQRLCREKGIDVKCISVEPHKFHAAGKFYNARGRTIFDHSWIEQYYLKTLYAVESEIDWLQKEVSKDHKSPELFPIAEKEHRKWRI